jgi:gamma-glutamyltranspeptidase
LKCEQGISPDTIAILKARGYDVDFSPAVVLARVEAILADGGWLEGGSDGRGAGKVAGY